MTRALGLSIVLCVGCAPTTSTSRSSPAAIAGAETPIEPPAKADAATTPTPTLERTPAPKTDPPIAWAELEPVRHVHTSSDGSMRVHVRERSSAVAKRYRNADAGYVEFGVDDKRLPEAVRAIDRVWVLTPAGLQEADTPLRASFSISSFGNNWAMTFAWKGDEHEGAIALPRAPHSSTRLVWPSNQPDVKGRLRKTIRSAAPADFRPEDDTPIHTQTVPARLPGGATKVVSGWWNDEEGSDVSYGVVLAVADDDTVVHRISKHRDYMTWASIQWVGDLDGDGIDEIGWGYGGIEDQSYFLTRFADGKKTEVELYAAGE